MPMVIHGKMIMVVTKSFLSPLSLLLQLIYTLSCSMGHQKFTPDWDRLSIFLPVCALMSDEVQVITCTYMADRL